MAIQEILKQIEDGQVNVAPTPIGTIAFGGVTYLCVYDAEVVLLLQSILSELQLLNQTRKGTEND